MKNKALFLLLIQLLLLPLTGAFALELNARLYERTVYTPKTPILIHITLKNDSSTPYRFNAAENRLFNLDFDVRNLRNLRLEHSEYFKLERNSSQRVFYREVVLLEGEAYSFVADLTQFVDIDVPGVYTVTSQFYPNLQRNEASPAMESNTITLQIHPDLQEVPAYRRLLDVETGEILSREKLPPDEVVEYTLRARQKSQWPKFFLYLDLEQLMLANGRLRMQYRDSSAEKRYQMIEDYRNRLMSRNADEDILLIPSDFIITHTSYTQSNGVVEVVQTFDYRDYSEKRKYTYNLHRHEGYWMIYDYHVMNMGTE
jgi:hypothetical protein